jgi:hypothetical protein
MLLAGERLHHVSVLRQGIATPRQVLPPSRIAQGTSSSRHRDQALGRHRTDAQSGATEFPTASGLAANRLTAPLARRGACKVTARFARRTTIRFTVQR